MAVSRSSRSRTIARIEDIRSPIKGTGSRNPDRTQRAVDNFIWSGPRLRSGHHRIPRNLPLISTRHISTSVLWYNAGLLYPSRSAIAHRSLRGIATSLLALEQEKRISLSRLGWLRQYVNTRATSVASFFEGPGTQMKVQHAQNSNATPRQATTFISKRIREPAKRRQR